MACVFCRMIRGELEALGVYEDEAVLAYLDHRPVFPGHILVMPRAHVETLPDLSADQLLPLFTVVQRAAAIMPAALQAEGTFIANNNVVSQSVPHVHVHVVPRRRRDGLRGFFWPRHPYKTREDALRVQHTLRVAFEADDHPA
jgi:histidine triad (HIT) family protein